MTKPLKIVVTGATGGLGKTACLALVNRVWRGVPGFDHERLAHPIEVVGVGRNEAVLAELNAMGVRTVKADLSRADTFKLARELEGADAVWHCAALSSPWGPDIEFFKANILATLNLVEAAKYVGVPRLVHVSTPAIYFNHRDQLNIHEGVVAQTFVNEYARTKYQAEKLVQDSGLQAVILRPRALFGENDQVLLPRLLKAAKTGGGTLCLPRGGNVLLDLTYLDNAVDALWLSTFYSPGPCGKYIFNITNAEPMLLSAALRKLNDHLDPALRFKVTSVPAPLAQAAAWVQEKVAKFTGKEPQLTRYSVGALSCSMTLSVSRALSPSGLHWRPRVDMARALEKTAAHLNQLHRARS